MCTWKLETPCTVPAGARISAGNSGSVDRSLPNDALTEVKRSPVSCMPSPESPAKRTTTRSRIVASPVRASGRWSTRLCRSCCQARRRCRPPPVQPYGSVATAVPSTQPSVTPSDPYGRRRDVRERDAVRRAGRRLASGWRRRRSAARRRRCSPTCCARLAPDEVAVAVGVLTGAPARDASASGGRRCATSTSSRRSTPSLDDPRGRPRRRPAGRDVRRRRRRARRRTCSPTCSAGRPTAEQRLLWEVFGGELRQGALDGVMVDAVAKAAGVPVAAVRRAHMLVGRPRRRPPAPALDRRRRRRWRAIGMVAGTGGAADAGVAGRRRRRRARRRPARRRSSGSSTAPGSRPTAATATCASSPATSTRSPTASARVVDARRRRCPAATSCSTARSLGRRRRRRAAPVPGHDGRLRRRCADRTRARAVGATSSTSSTPAARRRRRAAGRAPGAARRRSCRRRPGCRRSSPPTPARRRRSSTGAVGARPRGRDGQGARRRRTTPAGAAGRGARSSRSTRSTSSCSPPSGATAGAPGGCRTCTSAPGATTARS